MNSKISKFDDQKSSYANENSIIKVWIVKILEQMAQKKRDSKMDIWIWNVEKKSSTNRTSKIGFHKTEFKDHLSKAQLTNRMSGGGFWVWVSDAQIIEKWKFGTRVFNDGASKRLVKHDFLKKFVTLESENENLKCHCWSLVVRVWFWSTLSNSDVYLLHVCHMEV